MLGTKPIGNHDNNMWRSLRALHLSHNKLAAPGIGRGGIASGRCGLDVLLVMCNSLEELYLDGCGLTHEVVNALAETLKGENSTHCILTS